jgi:VanZ family protein
MLYFSSAPQPYPTLGDVDLTPVDVFGHLIGFVVFTLLLLRWWRFRAGELTLTHLLQALAIGLAYALLDELHQIPIPGRSFQWLDLLTDAGGVALGLTLHFALPRLRRA